MDTLAADQQQKTEQFGQFILDTLNKGGLALMTSIGHRTGLFDTMSKLPPATSEQIASAAGLNERYVREWLGAMTVGGIIECDPAGPSYVLPPEHAAFLTRDAQTDNIAMLFQFISVLGAVEDNIVDCFVKGGGVPYAAYARFHEVMASVSGQIARSWLIEQILPLVPGLPGRLREGIDVLDAGCGSGDALIVMAGAFPRSRFLGYDLSGEAIGRAREEASARGLGNIRFEVRDLTGFDDDAPPEAFDLVTAFDAIHDQARPDRVLTGIRKALKPGGVFLMQDVTGSSHIHENKDHPIGPYMYTVSCMHCMTVSLAQSGGMGLGAMWGRQTATAMLRAAGFSGVEIKSLPRDILNSYYIALPAAAEQRQAA